MENNSENKLRFFYQYGGQKVLKNEKYPEVSFLNGFFFFNNVTYIENYHLELRSIDSITDEECIELFNLTSSELSIISADATYKVDNIKFSLKWIVKNNKFHQFESDWLRSKGFLVPFMNLTTDQIIEFGWAKIKD